MKQFATGFSIEVKIEVKDCFKYLISAFSNLSFDKIKASVLDSSQIRKLLENENFIGTILENEDHAWFALKNTAKNFFGNMRA